MFARDRFPSKLWRHILSFVIDDENPHESAATIRVLCSVSRSLFETVCCDLGHAMTGAAQCSVRLSPCMTLSARRQWLHERISLCFVERRLVTANGCDEDDETVFDVHCECEDLSCSEPAVPCHCSGSLAQLDGSMGSSWTGLYDRARWRFRDAVLKNIMGLSDSAGAAAASRPLPSPPPPIFECNSQCWCDEMTCSNRLAQFGTNPHLRLLIVHDERKGFGVVTEKSIASGTMIAVYTGELTNTAAARCVWRDQESQLSGNYTLTVREHSSDGQVSLETCIDSRHYGNISRYFNHSCDPNLVIVPVRVDSVVPLMALFTRRQITAGEELCFDYGKEYGLSQTIHCYCGASNCTGWMPFCGA